MFRSGLRVVLLLPLLVAFDAAEATGQLPDDAVVIQPAETRSRAASSAAMSRDALAALAAGDGDAAWQALDRAADVIAFEQAAAAVIDTLMLQTNSMAVDQLLARLEQVPRRVFVQHEESAADWYLPLYDIPGKAASARRVLAAAARRDELLQALEVDLPKAIRTHRDDAPGVIVDALRLAPAQTIERIAQHALKGTFELPSPAWAALVRRLPRRDVLDAALVRAEPIDVLPLFAIVVAQADVDVALDWLQRAGSDPEYATVAVMSLGALAPRSPAAEHAVMMHLGRSDTGAAAAAALAQWAVPDRVARIVAISKTTRTPAQLRDLALALRLEGSPAANDALQRLARDPRLPAAAARELQR